MDSPLAVDGGGDATTAAATVTAISHRGGSSGGYLEHVFRGAASSIFGVVSQQSAVLCVRTPVCLPIVPTDR